MEIYTKLMGDKGKPSDETPAAEPSRLYHQIASQIADRIRDGTYAAGTRLPSERELSDGFEVSRPTIREAIIALELWNLVHVRQGSGIYVASTISNQGPAELDIGPFELTEARRLIEGEACALAATLISDAELAALETTLQEMIAENILPHVEESADRQFHMQIAEATRNSVMVAVIEALWDQRHRSNMCRHFLGKARAAGVRPRIDDHQLIYNALKNRDPAAARQAMRDHLARVIENLLTITEDEEIEKARAASDQRRKDLAKRHLA